MIYLACYLAIGMGLVIAALIYRLGRRRAPLVFRKVVRLRKATVREQIVEDVIPTIGAALLIVFAWPVFGLLLIKLVQDYCPERVASTVGVTFRIIFAWPLWLLVLINKKYSAKVAPTAEMPEEAFAVGLEDLLQQTSLPEIERRERIIDPMGGVPDLPFGHRYAAWKNFREGIELRDELWAFSAEWKPRWGSGEHRLGYAVRHEDRIGPYFISKIRPLRGFTPVVGDTRIRSRFSQTTAEATGRGGNIIRMRRTNRERQRRPHILSLSYRLRECRRRLDHEQAKRESQPDEEHRGE